MSTTPRVKIYYGVHVQTPISQLQIVGAKESHPIKTCSIASSYHEYHCVKCLLVGRMIFLRNVVTD